MWLVGGDVSLGVGFEVSNPSLLSLSLHCRPSCELLAGPAAFVLLLWTLSL